MSIFLTIFYTLLFVYIIYNWKFFNDHELGKIWFISAFTLKIVFSIFLTLIYTYYYTDRSTSDIYKYFDDSKIMFDALKNHPLDYFKMVIGFDNDSTYFNQNYYEKMNFWFRVFENNTVSDSHIIIRFNAVVRCFSFGSIYAHNVFINFFSFLGLAALYKFFKPIFLHHSKALFYAIFLIPSVLFWGSGLLKEGLILFALGFLAYGTQQFLINYKWYYGPLVLISLILLIYTKLYVLVALSLPMLSYLLHQKITIKKVKWSFVLSLLILATSLLFMGWYSPKLNLITIILDKHSEFARFIQFFEAKSSFKIPMLTDWQSILIYTPNAWLNTFIRPYLWESKSPFVLLSSLENIVFIFLLVVALFFPKKQNRHWYYVLFCFSFVLILFAIIGLIIPIFGALVRYKVPALPFLAVGLLLLIDIDLLKSKFSFLKRFL